MTDVLIDTSSWINFFSRREKRQAEVVTSLLKKGNALINGFILAELLQGVRKEEERKILEKRLLALRRIPVNEEEFLRAGHLSALLRQKGETVNLVDILIAQSAITHHLMLLHWDSDYHRIARHSSLKIHEDSLPVRKIRE